MVPKSRRSSVSYGDRQLLKPHRRCFPTSTDTTCSTSPRIPAGVDTGGRRMLYINIDVNAGSQLAEVALSQLSPPASDAKDLELSRIPSDCAYCEVTNTERYRTVDTPAVHDATWPGALIWRSNVAQDGANTVEVRSPKMPRYVRS